MESRYLEVPAANRILVVGINFTPELTGIGKYTGELVDWLSANGYQCTILTAFPYYPQWAIQSPYLGMLYKWETGEGERVVVRCPLYVPHVPTGFKRIIHDASFLLTALLGLVSIFFRTKHHYVVCIAPPFHLGFLGLMYRFFRGGKLVYHIQDLQIDAAKNLGLIRSQGLLRVLFRLEKFILDRADVVSTISLGMVKRIGEKTKREVVLFPNWVDTKRFFPLTDNQSAREEFGFDDLDRVVLYSGSIGEKQGLEAILDVAETLRGDRSLKFVICGAGPYKGTLEMAARTRGLDNVLFYSLQPIEKLNDFLNMADVHLVIEKGGAGDLVMPSKLTTILAVGGLAVVTTSPGTYLYDEIVENDMGLVGESGVHDQLVNNIKLAIGTDQSEKRLNARAYAEQFLSIDSVIPAFLRHLS